MSRHILDRQPRLSNDPHILRYARAARGHSPVSLERKLEMLHRRAKGRFDPAARLRAYLRIQRGIEA